MILRGMEGYNSDIMDLACYITLKNTQYLRHLSPKACSETSDYSSVRFDC